MAQRWRKDRRRRKAARRGHRRLRSIAGTLIRELERKLPEALRKEQSTNFIFYSRVLAQKPQDTAKICSLHQPHIHRVAKGNEHKKYEFGIKASVAMTKTHGVIVAALDQAEAITDTRAARVIVNRGYRGRKCVGGVEVLVPGRAPTGQSRAKSAAMRKRFRRRAAIEPLLGHLKPDFRLWRRFLKGFQESTQPDAGRCGMELPQMDDAGHLFWLRFLSPLSTRNFCFPAQTIA
jgi:transposase, IS5 family